jgi:hypothetical protein
MPLRPFLVQFILMVQTGKALHGALAPDEFTKAVQSFCVIGVRIQFILVGLWFHALTWF